MVLNDPPAPQGNTFGGPCYRCVYPRPPSPEQVTSCGEGGILGPVVGVMGVLQALEAIRILTQRISRCDSRMEQRLNGSPPNLKSSMLMFSAFSSPQFRSIKLRSRVRNCIGCSGGGEVSGESLKSGSVDYATFCGLKTPASDIPLENSLDVKQLSPTEHHTFYGTGSENAALLVDVRERNQYGVCNLPGSINVPFSEIQDLDIAVDKPTWFRPIEEAHKRLITEKNQDPRIHVICRLGNDSLVVVKKFQTVYPYLFLNRTVANIKGGFDAWREEVDHTWPEY